MSKWWAAIREVGRAVIVSEVPLLKPATVFRYDPRQDITPWEVALIIGAFNGTSISTVYVEISDIADPSSVWQSIKRHFVEVNLREEMPCEFRSERPA